MTDSRLTAILILQEIIENKSFASDARLRFEKEAGNDAFVTMLLQTTLRRMLPLRRILGLFVKRKLPAQAKFAHYALLLAATEILWLETPDYAVINSYVGLVKKKLDKYIAGFVNAVLRKIAADAKNLAQTNTSEFFPPEFRRILNVSYSRKTVREIENIFINQPELDLSCKAEPQLWAQKLNARLLPTGTLRLSGQGNPAKWPGYADGAWWVQDFAASLAVKTLGEDLSKQKVLDLCAAPGGKTAQLLSKGAEVTALDISAPRLERLRENICRLQLPLPQIICADAVSYLQNLPKPCFDAVILDAPCSATGTLRRHPEIIHIKNLADVEKQAAIQKEILAVVERAVKPGGFLVYCVCSLARAEGEEQMAGFLKRHPTFFPRRLNAIIPAAVSEILTPEGYIRTLPCHLKKFGGTDGFFVACLQKGQ